LRRFRSVKRCMSRVLEVVVGKADQDDRMRLI